MLTRRDDDRPDLEDLDKDTIFKPDDPVLGSRVLLIHPRRRTVDIVRVFRPASTSTSEIAEQHSADGSRRVGDDAVRPRVRRLEDSGHSRHLRPVALRADVQKLPCL